jgi:demethylmenaquinone methyltransferase/2-methoxy-6-polyprenyl-1,4-benzoquinol methylase
VDNSLRIARAYDLLLGPFLRPVRRAVVAAVQELPVRSIVDFCCGTGDQLEHLQRAGYDQTVGVDLAPEMLRQARRGTPPLRCSLQDATRTDLPTAGFDLGLVSLALHEKPRETAQAMLAELRRVVKPDGYLLLVDYCHDERTSILGRLGTTLAEFLAGGDHYRNFRAYLAAGGLDGLTRELELVRERPLLFGAARLRLYRNG